MDRVVFHAAVILAILAATTPAAFAQSMGSVAVDGAIIWRSDAGVPAAVASQGTVLELTGRSERWYEVIIPEQLGGRGDRGVIAIGQVTLVEGAEPPPFRTLPGSPPIAQTPQPRPPARGALAEPRVALRPFGQVGLRGFTARRSFDALFGEPRGAVFGGGLQLRFRPGVYVQGSIERFRDTGQRVFVFDGTIFPLGIADTVTIDAIALTAGSRFPLTRRVWPYGGGGIGTYRLRERSRFDEPSERVDRRQTGFQVHGGAEFTTVRWLAIAGEALYTIVPDALGRGGVSAEVDEHDLGGWQLQMKVLLGR